MVITKGAQIIGLKPQLEWRGFVNVSMLANSS